MKPPLVSCPTCKRSVEWSSDNLFRPFCSERCKMVDLGAWFAEEHRIASDDAPDGEIGDSETPTTPRN
jgi:uncharacterized protein